MPSLVEDYRERVRRRQATIAGLDRRVLWQNCRHGYRRGRRTFDCAGAGRTRPAQRRARRGRLAARLLCAAVRHGDRRRGDAAHAFGPWATA